MKSTGLKSTMAHTNYGELRQLFETLTRVREAGGQNSLRLHTLDGQARATLDPALTLYGICLLRFVPD